MPMTTTVGGAKVTTAHYARFSASLVASVIASMVGATLMAIVLTVAFLRYDGRPLYYPLQIIGTFLFGDVSLISPRWEIYPTAAALHFGVCAFWGLAFAFAATRLRVDKSIGGSIMLGLVVGTASQIVDIDLIAPALQNRLWGHDLWSENVPPVFSWLGHIVFGLSFAVFPFVFRRLWIRFSGRKDLLAAHPRIR
jgi:hypothetical protein